MWERVSNSPTINAISNFLVKCYTYGDGLKSFEPQQEADVTRQNHSSTSIYYNRVGIDKHLKKIQPFWTLHCYVRACVSD